MQKLYRNVLILASGSLLGRLIAILVIPVVTRIYSPADMGVLSAFTSITAVLVAFTSFRYSVVIPLPRTSGGALNASVLCFTILLIVTLITTLYSWVFKGGVFSFFNIAPLLSYWFVLPLSVFLFGLAEILNIWSVRTKNFKLLSRATIIQSATGSAVKVLLGFLGVKPLGLIIGQILLQAISILFLLPSYLSNFEWRKVKFKRVLLIACHYIDIPKFRLPSQVLLNLSTHTPILFFSIYFGSDVTGQIGLTLMVLSLPVTLIGQSIGNAFYGEIASIGRKKPIEIQLITKDIFRKLTLISLAPFFTVLFLGDTLFELFFGSEWAPAGEYAQVLSFYIVSNLISSPLVNILNLYNKNSFYLWINLSRFTVLMGIFSFSVILKLQIVETLVIYSVILSAHYLCVAALILKVVRVEAKTFTASTEESVLDNGE